MTADPPAEGATRTDAAKLTIEIIGTAAALTTSLAALLYYFGWARTSALYSYFGVTQDLLDFGTRDYLLRSVNSAVRPLGFVLALAAVAVPVHRVLGPHDVITDAQLVARRHFVEAIHPVLGPVWVENSRLRISGADTTPRRAGLLIGEHNDEVLCDILGLGPDETAELRRCGALH